MSYYYRLGNIPHKRHTQFRLQLARLGFYTSVVEQPARCGSGLGRRHPGGKSRRPSIRRAPSDQFPVESTPTHPLLPEASSSGLVRNPNSISS